MKAALEERNLKHKTELKQKEQEAEDALGKAKQASQTWWMVFAAV